MSDVLNHWRMNWGKSYGFIGSKVSYPNTLDEIVYAVEEAIRNKKSVRAIGGGWSFSDVALPFANQQEVDAVSMQKAALGETEDMSQSLRILGHPTTSPQPMDTVSSQVDASLSEASTYNQATLANEVDLLGQIPSAPGFPLEPFDDIALIDISGLASSLQETSMLLQPPGTALINGHYLFHVEAGIRMADLPILLDHQKPRMAIQATGGSPGATLAGTISTATHGGEWQSPLLIDMVRAVHLVAPSGAQFWIEGVQPIVDLAKLKANYLNINFIGGGVSPIPGMSPEDILNAVIVSMGTMGVIYAVVLEVIPQFGVEQRVVHLEGGADFSWPDNAPIWSGTTGWDLLLANTKNPTTVKTRLRNNDPQANLEVLEVLKNGALNGTGISEQENTYIDLAINPFNQECWITNRRVIGIPIDSNNPPVGITDYGPSVLSSLGARSNFDLFGSKSIERIFDFLHLDRDMFSFAANNDAYFLGEMAKFIVSPSPTSDVLHSALSISGPDLMARALAVLNVCSVLNERILDNPSLGNDPNRYKYRNGRIFLSDFLGGFLNAIQGTATNSAANRIDLSYKVGAIGWPDEGLPGRGVEIAMDPTKAFSFLQKEILDNFIPNIVFGLDHGAGDGIVNPLIGYISIRVTRSTNTLFGMQQFRQSTGKPSARGQDSHSVMIEIVGYRSPESNKIMDAIQQRALEINADPKTAKSIMLHWGLENDQMQGSDLWNTPLANPMPYNPTLTRIDAFVKVRRFFTNNGAIKTFENLFVNRLGLGV